MKQFFYLFLVASSGPKLLKNQPKLAQQDTSVNRAGMFNEKPDVSTVK